MGVLCQEKVTDEKALFGPCSRLPVEFLEHFLCGLDAVVLGLLKDGNAAEVGVGEDDAVMQTPETKALCEENRTDGSTNHDVTHVHDVDAGDTTTNVRVNAFEVM